MYLITYVLDILIPKGYKDCGIGLKVTAILLDVSRRDMYFFFVLPFLQELPIIPRATSIIINLLSCLSTSCDSTLCLLPDPVYLRLFYEHLFYLVCTVPHSLILCENIFNTPSLSNRKSWKTETLREGFPAPTCHALCVTCHVSCVTCHLSCFLCHV